MKLNNKQVEALAYSIVKQINDNKAKTVDKAKKAKIDKYLEERSKIAEQQKALTDKLNLLSKNLNKDLGSKDSYSGFYHNSYEEWYKYQNKNSVNFNDIEREITLKALFSTETDMQEFIKSIVDKYSK